MNEQNFISADFRTAINSFGDKFSVGDVVFGDVVGHQDTQAGIATIQGFSFDVKTNEIIAFTSKGFSHIDFLIKVG